MATKARTKPAFKKKTSTKVVNSVYPSPKQDNLPKSTWEQLDDIYFALANAIVEVSEEIRGYLTVILETGASSKEVVNNIVKTAVEDMTNFSKALVATRMRHEGRTGPIDDSDSNAEHIRISLDYEDIARKFQALSFQTIQVLLTHLQEAEDILSAKKKEEQVA